MGHKTYHVFDGMENPCQIRTACSLLINVPADFDLEDYGVTYADEGMALLHDLGRICPDCLRNLQ